MDISTLDLWATSGRSPLHRASALSKVVAALLVIAAIVAAQDLFVLLAIYLVLVAGVLTSRLPTLRVLSLAAYPALFALLFAVSAWNGSLLDPLLIITRAVTAATTMLLLIVTTPYHQLFAVLRHLLPKSIADALFITYRSIFILLDILGALLTALSLRGGFLRGKPLHNIRSLAAGVGLLLLRAIAYSEQLYTIMQVRGYSGTMVGGASWRQTTRMDLVPLLTAAAILAYVLLTRMLPEALQFNGDLLVLTFLAATAAAATRILYSRPSW
ncbi:MAG TPA: energy-coupling factor transporter transmembrane component T [Chloroflexota bacterium]|nr:energy-coupling factor transporter transmembrane component T [Chloroflexota bacterium]HEX2987083.1 energy-coupling factor transporter transmembrane component T [Chloroflexota bacterium]